MKTILMGDTHGEPLWKEIVNAHPDADRFIFMGDYFDSWDVPGEDQINNFLDIMIFKAKDKREVINLLGNHDVSYINNTPNVSGYQRDKAHMIKSVLSAYKNCLQMAYEFDGILCTHAGVSEQWLDESYPDWDMAYIAENINDLWKHRPKSFNFNGINPYGDDKCQTPIWIRPKSLLAASKEIKKHYIQVVGHTGVREIDIEGKATDAKYYFIDAIPIKQYLIHENGEFKLGQL